MVLLDLLLLQLSALGDSEERGWDWGVEEEWWAVGELEDECFCEGKGLGGSVGDVA